jgi:hypothetical protein
MTGVTMEQPVGRTVRVPKDIDVSVRTSLAQCGLKKRDLAKYSEEAERSRQSASSPLLISQTA